MTVLKHLPNRRRRTASGTKHTPAAEKGWPRGQPFFLYALFISCEDCDKLLELSPQYTGKNMKAYLLDFLGLLSIFGAGYLLLGAGYVLQ